MKMPMHCMECELAVYDNDNQKYCPFTNVMCLNIGIQNDCPLTEIPESHGRLIDADELVANMKSFYRDGLHIISGEEAISWVEDDAPTVIEGSE